MMATPSERRVKIYAKAKKEKLKICPIGFLRQQVYHGDEVIFECNIECAWARITPKGNTVCALVTR